MAVRFQSEFHSSRGILHRVSIIDADHIGGVTLVRLGGSGYVLQYDGENQERHNPILPSRCTVQVLIENATDENIIPNIVGSAENRFSITIEKHNGTDYDLFWFGNVLPDIGSIEDMSFPYVLEITATDGLATLKDVDYNDDGTAYLGDETLLEHIQNCLEKIPNLSDVYSATDVFIDTCINWYEESHTVAQGNDPLALTKCDHRAFTEYDNNGDPVFMSCYDVLRNILTTFMARIYMTDGVYVIEQINERVTASAIVRKYYFNRAQTSAFGIDFDKQITQTNAGARLGGGSYTFYPPLKSCIVTYNANNSKNFADGITAKNSGGPNVSFSSSLKNGASVALSATATTQLSIGMDMEIVGQYAGTPFTSQTHNFDVKIELEIKVGDRWLRRDYSSSYYSTPKWTNVSGKYVVTANVQVQTAPLSGTFNWYAKPSFLFTTPDLPVGGTFAMSATVTTQNGYFQLTGFEAKNLRVFVVYDGAAVTEDDFNEYTATVATTSTKKMEVATLLGDGTTVNSAGRLKLLDGTDTELWRLGADTTNKQPIAQFLANGILAGQDTAVRMYLGTIFGAITARNRIYWTIKGVQTAFLFNGGSYDAKLDEWNGEWFVIKTGSFGITNTVRTYVGGDAVSTGVSGGLIDFENVRPPVFGGVPLPQAFSLLAGATTSALATAGAQTTISVNQPLAEEAYPVGSTIWVVDPNTGNSQPLTVTAAIAAGATSISVSGTTAVDFPQNSYIVYPDSQIIQQSGGGYPSGGGGGTTYTFAGQYGIGLSESGGTVTAKLNAFTSYTGSVEATNTIPDTDFFAVGAQVGTVLYLKSDRANNTPIRIMNTSPGDITVSIATGSGHNIRLLDGSNSATFTLKKYSTFEIYRNGTLWRMTRAFSIDPGTISDSTLRWNGSEWVENTGFRSNASTVAGVGGLTIKGDMSASKFAKVTNNAITLHQQTGAYSTPSEGDISYNSTTKRVQLQTDTDMLTLSTTEDVSVDFVGTSITTYTGGGNTLLATDYMATFSAASGNVVIDIDAMEEGRDYFFRCNGNAVNTVTMVTTSNWYANGVNASLSGSQVFGGAAGTGVFAPYGVHHLRRVGSRIFLK